MNDIKLVVKNLTDDIRKFILHYDKFDGTYMIVVLVAYRNGNIVNGVGFDEALPLYYPYYFRFMWIV